MTTPFSNVSSMGSGKVVYLREPGISSWTSLAATNGGAYSTLTIVATDKRDLVSLLFSLLPVLAQLFQKLYRWHTVGVPFSGSRVQLRRLTRELRQDAPGFADTYLGEHVASGIWCNVSELVLPFREEQFDYLCGRNTLLMLVAYGVDTPEEAWEILSSAPEGYDDNALRRLLDHNSEVSIARAYEEETHLAFQIIGARKHIARIEKSVAALKITKTKDRDAVVDFMNVG